MCHNPLHSRLGAAISHRIDQLSSSGTRVPVWLRYLCSTPGWGLGGVDAVWPATRVGEGSVFS